MNPRFVCPKCGGRKDWDALACRGCATWAKPNLGRKGPAHTAWKGGQRLDRDGYIRTYAPDHPWPRRNGYVLEHVRVMELHIGRRIGPDECVHHEDGNRTNNALANLHLTRRGPHSSHHRQQDHHLRERDELGRFAPKVVMPNA